MLKKEITYIDFNRKTRTDTYYFNLSEIELTRLEFSIPGGIGLEAYVKSIDVKTNPEAILQLFENIIRLSYGKKSDDGRYFDKSEEETTKFMNSAAYSAFFISLIQDADAGAEFIKQIVTYTTTNRPARKSKDTE